MIQWCCPNPVSIHVPVLNPSPTSENPTTLYYEISHQ